MAVLKAEDPEFESSLTIEPGKLFTISAQGNSQAAHALETQTWQHVKLILKNNEREVSFEIDHNTYTNSNAETNFLAHAYLFCRSPQDEVAALADRLNELAAGERTQVMFEPAEPSFELSVKSVGESLKVEFFVDAGNVETGIYRWDSLGIRFFTSTANLSAFAASLKSEFAW
jgi:hypothetical protein